ncbi:MAG: hypothetical protein US71_C0012G0003 [Parcubacteria group bacterium GW2011_GWD2_38_12]|nr:MAG: hypothetical protein US06_C0009G0024 [Parcubacteria group bacterium GW2011_GWC2_36_17]KKQ38855.1 MAG: hypothetical protein US56_C0034G0005 [Candidatus Moranbacteria bacterium GW2011_GWF2_37_7]KKQ51387.1 MAG: hypothetical protein US71_C0012G0003 [Parcubacteria group bacterium GW2011_GWD2_38_12]KKQ58441.1 MAG: hypothetical protein US79_C0007G0007 [Parcubacteria group bacterium GW2011_GWC1_38_17]
MSKDALKQLLKPILRAMIFLIISLVASLYFASRIRGISEIITEKRAMLSLYQNSQEQSAVLKEDFPKISKHIDRVENALPSSENMLPFINAVENLSGANEVQQSFKFENITPQLIPDLGLNAIPFNVTLSGNRSQFLAYLSSLEKLPYFTKIVSINIMAAQGFDGPSQISLRGLLYTK